MRQAVRYMLGTGPSWLYVRVSVCQTADGRALLRLCSSPPCGGRGGQEVPPASAHLAAAGQPGRRALPRMCSTRILLPASLEAHWHCQSASAARTEQRARPVATRSAVLAAIVLAQTSESIVWRVQPLVVSAQASSRHSGTPPQGRATAT